MKCKWKRLAGCVLLNRYFLTAPGDRPQRALAELLGTHEQVVHSWKIGFRRPGPDFREALERLIRIPRDAWRTGEEKRRQRRLAGAGILLQSGATSVRGS